MLVMAKVTLIDREHIIWENMLKLHMLSQRIVILMVKI